MVLNPTGLTRCAVIMAGGAGERFWPLSRKRTPKQLLALTDSGKSMLDEAVDRISPLIPPERIYVQTTPELQAPIREALTVIPKRNVISEPCRRNTAGCLVYAVAHMLAEYDYSGENISMAILTADHSISPHDAFRRTVHRALRAAETGHVLATIGIPPTRPATGYGYIQAAGEMDGVLEVSAFHEKPQLAQAEAYLAAGNCYWNSGMFFWRASTFLEELRDAGSSLADIALQLAVAKMEGYHEEVERVFSELESVSIDYALMEKAKRIVMVPAEFVWDDIGTWAALDRCVHPDAEGNIVKGESILIDCSDSIVYNNAPHGAVAVSVIGVSGLVVVTTGDALLVVPKERAEDVKIAVQELYRRDLGQL